MKSETPLSLVLGGIRTHNLLVFGLTTKPSCLGAQQEDILAYTQAFDLEGQVDSLYFAQALRRTDAQATFYIFCEI